MHFCNIVKCYIAPPCHIAIIITWKFTMCKAEYIRLETRKVFIHPPPPRDGVICNAVSYILVHISRMCECNRFHFIKIWILPQLIWSIIYLFLTLFSRRHKQARYIYHNHYKIISNSQESLVSVPLEYQVSSKLPVQIY